MTQAVINNLAESNRSVKFRAAADACLRIFRNALDEISRGCPFSVDRRSAVFRELVGKARGAEDLIEEAGFQLSADGHFWTLPEDANTSALRTLVAELSKDASCHLHLRDQRRSHAMRTSRLAAIAAQQQNRQESRALADAPTKDGVARDLLENEHGRLQVCLKTLRIIFTNILDRPDVAKFRRIKQSNPKLMADVISAQGGMEMLQSVGFVLQGEHMVFPQETPLFMLRAGLDALKNVADLRWSRAERIHIDQREQLALSIAYELLYEMGDIDDPGCSSKREERLRAHLCWRDDAAPALPDRTNTLEDMHAIMALDSDGRLTVEQRMELRRRKLAMNHCQ